MDEIVIGLNGFEGVGHDGGASLVVNGRLTFAVEEERLSRTKRAHGTPPLLSLAEILRLGSVPSGAIDAVAYPWSPPAMGVDTEVVRKQIAFWFGQIGSPLASHTEICFVDHHDAHAWAGLGFLPAEATGRKVAVLVVDGTGECTSGAAYRYHTDLTRVWNLEQTSSLGIFYEAITAYVGFKWGEEGKTMGLAAYGGETSLSLPDLPDRRFQGPLPSFDRTDATPRKLHEDVRADLLGQLHALLGEPGCFRRRADVAFAGQQIITNRMLSYATELVAGAEYLVLSGGVALNCSANAHLARYCRERGVGFVVPPPASDTGSAIGAALATAHRRSGRAIEPVGGVGLGRSFAPDEAVAILDDFGLRATSCEPADVAARLLDGSQLCGWFEGGAEVGPRALGHRSVIARPDSAAVRDKINYLKGRESWRPLAPSVSRAEFDRSFTGSSPSPHMLIAARAASGAGSRLDGVIHVDGTSRPQVVAPDGPYAQILAAVGLASGTEAVTCTSFNSAGEPIVYSPYDALATAPRLGLDFLAGNGWLCELA